MSAVPERRTAGELVAWAARRLAAASDSPRLDAELLLAASAGIGRAALYADPGRPVDPLVESGFADAIDRRRRGEPLAYITGRREFWSLSLAVDPAVLVPRPETELLVEQVLAAAAGLAAVRQARPPGGAAEQALPPLRVLDLGTGSGAIALALKRQLPALDVWAVDREPGALALARANADALGLSIRLACSDWFAALADEDFDLIVSNPPYVAAGDPHFDGPLRFEPRAALDGGRDGLDAYRAILDGAAARLRPGGSLWFEHGHDQRSALEALAAAAGFRCVARAEDLAGLPRVTGFVRGGGHGRDRDDDGDGDRDGDRGGDG